MENYQILHLFAQIFLFLATFTLGMVGYVLLSSHVGKKVRTGSNQPLRFS
ncbi:hypothetical protein [Rufibacter quisquiliarum]|uniref:Membrane glycosyltransferase n=1 Tax=Rufibacter quisquiliarum TaxID=1549639 RepID=A0A839GFJ9_9BACT|nr:hypothetical protein [Rufibacter quisquiliarum]MBA9077300.1 membrane glycosyltransferase [Rufibacter quisquiliarum]